MRKGRMLLILGVWVAALPYLGFPYFWKNILLTAFGLIVALSGYFSYQELRVRKESKPENFKESETFAETQPAGEETRI